MMRRSLAKWIMAASVSGMAYFGVTASLETARTSSASLESPVRVKLELGPGEADAVIGRPATPGSVAGVARRTTRRTVRRTGYYY